MTRTRRENPDTEQTVRVRVFINLLDFAQAWQFEHAKITRKNLTNVDKANALLQCTSIRWELLPQAILDRLELMEYIGDIPKEMRAVDVYVSAGAPSGGKKPEFEVWLDDELDPYAGFEVHKFPKKEDRTRKCPHCSKPFDRPEVVKGLNTKVACDLLSHAVNDSYDIAVLIMNDPEIVPSVLSVQEIFDKQIIHVGLSGKGDALRSAAWGNFPFKDMFSDLVTSEDVREGYQRGRR